MMTIEQLKQFWLNSGTASTHHLYGGTPEELYAIKPALAAFSGQYPIRIGVELMLKEAPEIEMSVSREGTIWLMENRNR